MYHFEIMELYARFVQMTAQVNGFPAPSGWILSKSGVGTPDFVPLPGAVKSPASL